MILCLWTAVHLNIPEYHNHSYKYLPRWQTLRKTLWLLLGLFAPEIVTWTAFEQHREAKLIYDRVRKALGEKPLCTNKSKSFRQWLGLKGKEATDVEQDLGHEDRSKDASPGDGQTTSPSDATSDARSKSTAPEASSSSPSGSSEASPPATRERKHKWMMTHSYYALMGGFAFGSREIGDGRDFLPGGRKRVTLSGHGLILLLEIAPHLLPDISVAQIEDKSKANQLAKFIVTLQALWFAAQFISRVALGMTVSLLELNTFAHAICALIAYSLWWHKPLDVEEPTLIDGRDADIICAGLCTGSTLDAVFPAKNSRRSYLKSYVANPEQGHDGILRGRILTSATCLSRFQVEFPEDFGTSAFHVDSESRKRLVLFAGPRYACSFMFQVGQNNFYLPYRNHRLLSWGIPGEHSVLSPGDDYLELSAADILRLRMARQCYTKYPSVANDGKVTPWLTDRAENWPNSGSRYTSTHVGAFVLTFFIAGLAYGGLHLLAWDPPVQTAAETTFWRVSGLSIIVYGAILVILALCSELDDYDLVLRLPWLERWFRPVTVIWHGFDRLLDRTCRPLKVYAQTVLGLMSKLVVYGMGCIAILATLLYVISRIYLVVESCISVAHLPESVFETPKWTKYLPHLG
ncbi:hypothetical protein QBC47DRAFT_365350 [Echria macrotheca]|uniref:Uncharacterized protein n=1 Tax=Echria macrotheca TaxID=438768 RepID=A0AAJ0B2P6_9PEZI|nr:hypothetical protein QBC47DRAFT_365350 [Echria macrotheca]